MAEWLFTGIAAFTIASAMWVVFSKNLIYSAVALLFTLFGVAGLYIFLFADFIAATQVIVYVGGILVLIIFGVMLTNKISDKTLTHSSRFNFMSVIVTVFVLVLVQVVNFTAPWMMGSIQSTDATVAKLGEMILTPYLLPFEVASLLLLGALMGAALLSRKKNG